ncbi:MAG: dUTP diphosphatase [Treponemataceae bacterium]
MSVTVKISMQQGASLPSYQSSGAAGCDIAAFLKAPITLQPLERFAVPTGLSFEIPQGYEIQIRPRSGLAVKNGITCLNTPGTIDSDYRGEVKVILINLGQDNFTVQNGDRIAQIVLAPVVQASFIQCDNLTQTERGEKGFGSSGI